MDEIIYRFLLQAGYPRAAIVDDLSLLPVADVPDPALADGRPAYAIVDPDTADRLALVDTVGPVDADALLGAATALGRYARRFGGRDVQAFLVRVDPTGDGCEEQVRFYRVWPNETPRRVSPSAFPDLASLRTRRLLIERRDPSAPDVAVRAGRGSTWVWAPGAALVLLAVADGAVAALRGDGFLRAAEALLLIGGAALLLAPALVRRGRR